MKLSACFIGSTDLLLECITIFLKKKHEVLSIISQDKSIKKWAYQNNINVFSTIKEFSKYVPQKSFDYLFSIVNYSYLPPNILEFPKKFSINYHDALLPKYSGVYATTWAILNNEKKHGITWHVMTPEIDAGDILIQIPLPIGQSDSAYTLNINCYQKAVQSFSVLTDQLAFDSYTLQKQDHTKRSYFDFYKRPLDLGVINWLETADQIERKSRSLYFGHVDNPFLSQKILLDKGIIIPTQLEISKDCSNEKPGSILEISYHHIKIATKNGNVFIKQAKNLGNQTLLPNDIQASFHLKEKQILPFLYLDNDDNTQELIREAIRNENLIKSRWEVLSRLESIVELPKEDLVDCHSKILDQSIILHLSEKYKVPSSFIVLLTLSIYLYKINDYKSCSILVNNHSYSDQSIKTKHFFSYTNLVALPINSQDSFEYLISHFRDFWKKESKRVCFSDIFIRNRKLLSDKSLPILFFVKSMKDFSEKIALYSEYELFFFEESTYKFTYYPADLSNRTNFYPNDFLERLDKILSIFFNQPKTTMRGFDLILSKEKFIEDVKSYDLKESDLILQRFKSTVKNFPEKSAILDGEKTYSYSQLDALSNSIAHAISKRTKGNEDQYVVVYLEKQIDFIISIIAILKCGLAYVPISPNQPLKRVQEIIEDSMPVLVMTDQSSSLAHQNYPVYSIPLCIEEKIKFEEKKANLEDIAYMIYTSGSTGKPKGVKITHRNIARLFQSTNQHLQFASSDRWILLHSVGFDFSVWEIWGCFLSAGLLVLLPDSIKRSPKSMGKFIKDHDITVLNQTPVYFNQMVDAVYHEDTKLSLFRDTKLRYIIFGGDKLDSSRLRVWRENISKPKLINMYGITETTIHASFYDTPDNIIRSRIDIPIGKPLDDLRFYILDSKKRLVPPGLAGELYVAGDGLSVGYHHLPNKTSESFVVTAIQGRSERLYRTGDRILFLKGTGYLFLGRIDKQLKIRGFRIEPTEVDYTLLSHPNINQSYTILKTYGDNKEALISYIVPKSFNDEISEVNLKTLLRTKLPEYMIPSYIIPLHSFPLNSSYKIDRSLLPTPKSKKFTAFKATHSENNLEQVVISVWEEILGVSDIKLDDNFFELGGHSLLLTTMLVKLSKIFNVNIDPQSFILSPTVNQIIKLLTKQTASHKIIFAFIKDIHCFDKIKLVNLTHASSSKKQGILLTGASGFLGIYLLNHLIKKTRSPIYMLLRGEDKDIALSVLERQYASIFDEKFPNNAIPILGDISKQKLGLTSSAYKEIATSVDIIFHNAAQVNHLLDYSQVRKANVDGTLEILQLANQSVCKSIHYISTLSAAIEADEKGLIKEDFLHSFSNINQLINGYIQSKWVSEMLLSQAHQRGCAINIYRPGWILGACKEDNSSLLNNHLLNFCAGCIKMGSFPDFDGVLDILPVDFLARVIVGTLDSPYQSGYVFNCSNQLPILWKDFVASLSQSGFSFEKKSYIGWQNLCRHNVMKDNPLYRFLSFYMSNKTPYIVRSSSLKVQHSAFDSLLKYYGIKTPIIDNQWINKYFVNTLSRLLKKYSIQ